MIHSHPGGFLGFSAADDSSDQATMAGVLQALGPLHGTAVMVPEGAIRTRLYGHDLLPESVGLVSVAGDVIERWWSDGAFSPTPLAFTSTSTSELGRLVACVIGVSGTGSVVAEQAARLGFGQVILIDFDTVEFKNLNRIVNSTIADATSGTHKVTSFARGVESFRGLGVAVPTIGSITDREGVLAASQADVLFSCVDTLEARQIADLMGAAFLIPLFDVGVAIPTRRTNGIVGIADVCGRVDYVRPGGATLRDRGVYDAATLRAEYLRRAAPGSFDEEVRSGYLKGLVEQAPAVMSLNMRAGAACVMELIARLFPFRHDANSRYARTQFSLAASEEEHASEADFSTAANPVLGRGNREPLLGLPSLGAAK